MSGSGPVGPMTFGLFEKRIDGDDCLMELARLRFQQAGMGAEMHAVAPEQLGSVLRFRPFPEAPVVVHLPREWNLEEERCRQRITEFAACFAGRVHGLVLHDHADMAVRPEDFLKAALEMDSRLQPIERCPMLFIEYAAGLEPGLFAEFFRLIRALVRISACVDIGHVGIRQARRAYAQIHPGQDICAVKSRGADLPGVMADVESAVNTALPTVIDLIEAVGVAGKPVHFHLHDGHPLSTSSPFGISDHLSFLAEVRLAFNQGGRRSVPLMFGRAGLSRIVSKALEVIGAGNISFTLEIHPTFDRMQLGDAAPLFSHWQDKTNAEKMNHWLSVLAENHRLLREAIDAAQRPQSRDAGRAGSKRL